MYIFNYKFLGRVSEVRAHYPIYLITNFCKSNQHFTKLVSLIRTKFNRMTILNYTCTYIIMIGNRTTKAILKRKIKAAEMYGELKEILCFNFAELISRKIWIPTTQAQYLVTHP